MKPRNSAISRHCIRTATVVWLAFAALTTRADTNSVSLSLEDCIHQALQKNLLLEISRVSPELAQMNLEVSRMAFDPSIRLSTDISTASTPGGVDGSGGGGGGGDPRLSRPEVRPALYSLSSSLQEVPAVGGAYLTPNGFVNESAITNTAGDLLEGLTRLEPVVTLQITQYSFTDQSGLLQYTGSINSDQFVFSGHTVPVHCCMFQSLNASPYVESGFRGFQLDFQFSFRWNFCPGVEDNGTAPLGWDQPIVMSGYNIINTGLGAVGVQQEHLLCKLDEDESGFLKTPLELGLPNQKVRAQIPAQADQSGRTRQHAAASPVLLNIDGSPRSRSLPPLVYRYQTQPAVAFGNNFSNFGINSFY